MNPSAENALKLARELGGDEFVNHLAVNGASQAMANHVFPLIAQHRFTPAQARVVDLAFMIGLFEEWKRNRESKS